MGAPALVVPLDFSFVRWGKLVTVKVSRYTSHNADTTSVERNEFHHELIDLLVMSASL
jgi:hypothetical protein